MAVFLSWASWILTFACLARCQKDCASPYPLPISIPIHDIDLQAPVTRRGIAASLGSPAQSIAFQAQLNVNETWVYDSQGFCGSDQTDIQCYGNNGGAFDPNASTSWNKLDALKDNQVPEDGSIVNVTNDVIGSDVLTLNASTKLENFTFHFPRQRYSAVTMNSIGLGSDSTLLKALQNTSQIASRSFSYFQGLTGEDLPHQMDGNLLLGGIDQAKMQGTNYTSPLVRSANCNSALLVTITDIEMTVPGTGEAISIIGDFRGSAIQACIHTDNTLINIPLDVWDNFASKASGDYLGRAYGLKPFGAKYKADGVYPGSVTFTLQSGLKVEIPNDQLISRDTSITKDGNTVFNSTIQEVMLNGLEDINKNDMPQLGQAFLSQVYLHVNYDLGIFSMWNARATTDEDLIGVGPGGSVGCPKQGSATVSGSRATPAPRASSGMSTSAKIGVILGTLFGVAAFVLIMLAVRYWRRRKGPKRYHSSNQTSTHTPRWWTLSDMDNNSPQSSDITDTGTGVNVAELSDHSRTRRDLPELQASSQWPKSHGGSSEGLFNTGPSTTGPLSELPAHSRLK